MVLKNRPMYVLFLPNSHLRLLHAYTYFVAWMLNGMLRDRGFRKAPNVIDLLMAAPINVMLGGPPLQLPMQLPAKAGRHLGVHRAHFAAHQAMERVGGDRKTKKPFLWDGR